MSLSYVHLMLILLVFVFELHLVTGWCDFIPRLLLGFGGLERNWYFRSRHVNSIMYTSRIFTSQTHKEATFSLLQTGPVLAAMAQPVVALPAMLGACAVLLIT